MNKHIVSYLLILCLLFTVCSNAFAGAIQVSEDSFLGKWSLASVSAEGMMLPASMIGMSMTLDIQKDGTIFEGSFDGDDEYTEVESSFDGQNMIITMDNSETLILTLEEESHIRSEIDGTELHFEKIEEDSEKDATYKLSNVAANDFYGTWSANYVEIEGTKLPVAFIGASISLEINDRNAILKIDEGNGPSEVEGNIQLSGDVLIVNVPDMMFAVNLYSDGTASFELDGLEVYLKKESDYVEPTKEDTANNIQTTLSYDKLPIGIMNGSGYLIDESDITCAVNITDINYEVRRNNIYVYLTGEMIAAPLGSSETCRIAWRLKDSEGYVVDSGAVYTDALGYGERFRNLEFVIAGIETGNYTLQFQHTSY